MNLANWMMMELLPMDMAAAKYIVGQDLTKEQAKEIIQIIAHSVARRKILCKRFSTKSRISHDPCA